MPKIEAKSISPDLTKFNVLERVLIANGYVSDPDTYVKQFTQGEHSVFVVSRLGENGDLNVENLVFPTDIKEHLSPILDLPFTHSDRLPDEEGV